MDVYLYQAALLCGDCGRAAKCDLYALGQAPEDPEDEYSFDSGDYPKGPYHDGGGEADGPQHCDTCGTFLENPLTSDGYRYVSDKIAEAKASGRKSSIALTEWAVFYDLKEEA